MSRRPMGFLAVSDKPTTINNNEPTHADVDTLLKFDSGRTISFPEGTHNTLILGSTGSGKTSSVVLPSLNSLIKSGYPGLIIDQKNNMTDKVRALAKLHGRENDIVEFGSFPTACRTNLLADLDSKQIYPFFRKMAGLVTAIDDRNSYWHSMGVRIATDVCECLRFIERYQMGKQLPAKIPVDILSIAEVLNDYPLARKIFAYFRDTVLTEDNHRYQRFAKKVGGDPFHVFTQPRKINDDGTEVYDEHYESQLIWRLAAVQGGLDLFLETPSLHDNFSAPIPTGINLAERIFHKKKIVILRFSPADGDIAAVISRYLIEEYYKAVLRNGLSMPDTYTFLIADEFQHYADLAGEGNKRWSDNAFTALAREFRSIQIFASQSASALLSRGASVSQLEEFVNNCNNRVFFFGDDIVTQNLAARSLSEVILSNLQPGECFASTFDSRTRRHVHSVERLQEAHDALKTILSDIPQSPLTELKEPESEERQSLEEIMDAIVAKAKADERAAFEAERAEMRRRFEEHLRQKRAEEEKTKASPAAFPEAVLTVTAPTLKEKDEEEEESNEWLENRKKRLPDAVREIIEAHESLFRPLDYERIEVPQGWVSHLIRAISAAKRISFPHSSAHIISIKANRRGSGLYCELSIANSMFEIILNNLLSDIPYCASCGCLLSAMYYDGQDFYLCDKCLEENELLEPGQDLLGESDEAI